MIYVLDVNALALCRSLQRDRTITIRIFKPSQPEDADR